MRCAWLPDSILNYLVPDPYGAPPSSWMYVCMCVYMRARNRVGARAVLTVGELRQESVITDVISRRLDLSMAYHAPPRPKEPTRVDAIFADYTRCIFMTLRRQ